MQIALVDPSRTVRRIVGDLIRHEGHQVCPLSDGDEALAYIKANQEARALITCVELASMSGIDLCRQARAIAGNRRPLYILLMSSSDEQNRLVQALDNGADDFICKPPIAEELRARLRAADRVTTMQRELFHYATTDFLTGVLNRRAFFESFAEACERARMESRFLPSFAISITLKRSMIVTATASGMRFFGLSQQRLRYCMGLLVGWAAKNLELLLMPPCRMPLKSQNRFGVQLAN